MAQQAFDSKDYSLARKAARFLVSNWPLSDYAPQGQYLVGRCQEALGQDEKAFDAYQKLVETYPKVDLKLLAGNPMTFDYQEVLQRQFAICNRFLAGQWFKLWGYIPFFSSMDKTVAMYEKLVKNGPYSEVAPLAQLNIGAAREKQTRFFNDNEPFLQAAKAYELAADRYQDRPKISADAMYKTGLAYFKQARTAEYDQSTAGKAVDAFSDFIGKFPEDPRVGESKKMIDALKLEQARGFYEVARYYEQRGRWSGARIYYNATLQLDPNSPYAATAMQKIADLNKRLQKTAP